MQSDTGSLTSTERHRCELTEDATALVMLVQLILPYGQTSIFEIGFNLLMYYIY